MERTNHPLIFQFREPIACESFVAGVTIVGRVVACREDDGEWWFYGVTPSAIAEGAATPQEAFVHFMMALRTFLTDTATEAASFDGFRNAVTAFVRQTDDVEAGRWDAALAAVRLAKMTPEAPFDSLPRWSGTETPFGVDVVRLAVDLPTPAKVAYSASTDLLQPAA